MEDPYQNIQNTQNYPKFLSEDEESFNTKDSNILEHALLKNFCNCNVCSLDSQEKITKNNFYDKKFEKVNKKTCKGFTWLLEKLSEISLQNICKVNIPDTVVFKFGKPAFFLQQIRDRSLKTVETGEKLKIQEIIKSICSISRNRKREDSFMQVKNRASLLSISEYGKEVACLRFMNKDRENFLNEFFAYDEEGAIRVMSENEFMGLM